MALPSSAKACAEYGNQPVGNANLAAPEDRRAPLPKRTGSDETGRSAHLTGAIHHLNATARFANIRAMKFLGAIFAYAAMAFILGWGILQAVHGHYWLLTIGFLGYMAMLIKLGCLPPKTHH